MEGIFDDGNITRLRAALVFSLDTTEILPMDETMRMRASLSTLANTLMGPCACMPTSLSAPLCPSELGHCRLPTYH